MNRIKEIAESKDFSVADLANFVGLSRQGMYDNIQKDIDEIKYGNLRAIAYVLGVEIEYLRSEDDNEK